MVPQSKNREKRHGYEWRPRGVFAHARFDMPSGLYIINSNSDAGKRNAEENVHALVKDESRTIFSKQLI